MDKKRVNLEKGYVEIYDFGLMKLHAYKTNDSLDDEVILLEKKAKLVVIETAVFYDNIKELEKYIEHLNVTVEGVLISYHVGGGTFLKNAKKYITKNAEEYGYHGAGKGLIEKFTAAFGEKFDSSFHKITDYIEAGKFIIADIKLNIIPTTDGYDIEIPEINSIYTHMLGADCHSIIAGVKHANSIINTLKRYIQKKYKLIVTSHYVPEDLKAVETKIAYIETILNIADESKNKIEMIDKVKREYPEYSGENYLKMTANMFFEK